MACLALISKKVTEILRSELLASDGAAEVVEHDLDWVWHCSITRQSRCALSESGGTIKWESNKKNHLCQPLR